MKSSYLPLDVEDSADLYLEDEEEVAKTMKDMGRKKKKKSSKRKKRRIKQEVNFEEDYNDEEEGMEMEEEGNAKEVGISKAQERKKDDFQAKRRRGGEKAHGKGKEITL